VSRSMIDRSIHFWHLIIHSFIDAKSTLVINIIHPAWTRARMHAASTRRS
jgi:hypothetical protein